MDTKESFIQAEEALWKVGRPQIIDYFRKKKGQRTLQSTLQAVLNGSIYVLIQVPATQEPLLSTKLNAKAETKAQIQKEAFGGFENVL